MNTKFELITTKKCLIPLQRDPDSLIEVNLSVICQNGKYGLLYSPQPNLHKYTDLLTLPIEYDNIFFEEVNFTTYLIAVSYGTQSLYKLEINNTETNDEVIATKLLPPGYDRIVTCRKEQLFLLHNGDTVCFFDPCDEKEFALCNRIEHLYEQYFLCTTDSKTVLWDTISKKPIFTIRNTDSCRYVGTYTQGDVFKFTYFDDDKNISSHQLLFYDYLGHEAHLSPRAESITIHTKLDSIETRVVGVDMSWGDWQSIINIDEIVKEQIL